jgi:hypothetical protein
MKFIKKNLFLLRNKKFWDNFWLTTYSRAGGIAQAVSRWLPTAGARVQTRVWSSGICGGQSGAEAGFSEYFGFPCQYSFHQILHHDNHPGQVQ